MDLVLAGSMGNSAVAVLKNKALKPGTLLLECLFVSEAIAPRALQLQRYLPPTPVRCLLDINGNDLAAKVAFDTLDAQLDSVPRHLATKIAKSQRDLIQTMLNKAEVFADVQHDRLVEEAGRRFTMDLDEEVNRLKALRNINPTVRPEEILTLEKHKAEGLSLLNQAKIRLDAIRVLVVG